jgi:hypothetical protein
MKTIRKILSMIYHGIRNKIAYGLIYIKYNKKLKSFKNIHKGKRCFIIGNGPSLKMEDLDKLKNEYTFAANKIYVAFEETDWRPTYYCIQDFRLIALEFEFIKQKVEAKVKFIAGNNPLLKKRFWKGWIYFFLDTSRFYLRSRYPNFSEDISKRIFEGWTVTYANIQLAAYMGFKEIYLLGIDHNYSMNSGSKNHFSEKYMTGKMGKEHNLPHLEYSTPAYEAARQYAEHNAIKIYNATRGGKLEVFERVDFDTIIKNNLSPPPPITSYYKKQRSRKWVSYSYALSSRKERA